MLDAFMHQELSIATLQLLWGEWCKNLIPKLYILIGTHKTRLYVGIQYLFRVSYFNWFLAGEYFWKGYSLFWIIWKCNFVLTSWLPALWRLQYTSILLFIQVCQLLVQKHQSDYIRMHSNKLEQPIKTKTYSLLIRYITKYVGLTFHNMNTHKPRSPHPLQKHSTLWRAL